MLFYKDKRIAELERDNWNLRSTIERLGIQINEIYGWLDEKEEMIDDLESYIEELKQPQKDYSNALKRIQSILRKRKQASLHD